VADLTAAYPDVKGKVWRGVALLKRANVLVQDEVASEKPVDVLWAMHTEAKVDLNGKSAVLRLGDSRLLARILEPAGARFELISASPPPPQRQNRNVRKLVVRLPGKVDNVRLAVLLSPYRQAAQKPTFIPPISPLEEWRRR